MTRDEIDRLFREEFGVVAEEFATFDLDVAEARTSQDEHVWHPGVYVWWHPSRGVIKVGRHLTNARKRALEHVRDDTAGSMRALADDDETRLLLFNVTNPDKRHWVAALEAFFEARLSPEIAAGRLA